MIYLYRLIFIPILLIALPSYLYRGLRRGHFFRGMRDRFGLYPKDLLTRSGKPRIWIQAVSVGEIKAIKPLLEKLQGYEIILTSTTQTAHSIALKEYAGLCRYVGLFPTDFWGCMHRAWARIQPDLLCLVETELWPECLHQARKRGVPCLILNGRLSLKSMRRYKRIRLFLKPFLQALTRVIAASGSDAQHYEALGVAPDNIQVSGNLKCDFDPGPPLGDAEKEALLKSLGLIKSDGKPYARLILGASTWPGEERMLQDALQRLRDAGHDVALLLVPRHAERRNELKKYFPDAPFRSEGPAKAPSFISIADTTGELDRLTQLADIVVVGKSFPPNQGGQTPITAAALGKIVLYGPHMENFSAICRSLEDAQASIGLPSAAALLSELKQLLQDPARCQEAQEASTHWARSQRGATLFTLEQIRKILPLS